MIKIFYEATLNEASVIFVHEQTNEGQETDLCICEFSI